MQGKGATEQQHLRSPQRGGFGVRGGVHWSEGASVPWALPIDKLQRLRLSRVFQQHHWNAN